MNKEEFISEIAKIISTNGFDRDEITHIVIPRIHII